jgi:predicted alpha-1,6-mannanase (GH76 family)
MSTEKWESVTWDWLEREIVDCLLIAGRRRIKSASLARMLKGHRRSSVRATTSARKHAGERNNV